VPERLKAAELQGFATFCSELHIAANLLIIGAGSLVRQAL